ncbi:MAG: hypothetical protein GSR84_03450 [Desulfurococcales archaeon]|nr:hypothetical protein [Desulfurococcales archaeon]
MITARYLLTQQSLLQYYTIILLAIQLVEDYRWHLGDNGMEQQMLDLQGPQIPLVL